MFDDVQVIGRANTGIEATNKVLRNTYTLLGLTMIPTVIGAMLGMSAMQSGYFNFVLLHPFIFSIGFMAVMFGMFTAISANRNSSIGVMLLLLTTGLFGLMLGPILTQALHFRNGAELIGMAAGGTGIVFLTLSTIATVTKKDFSFMGKFLFIGLILMIVASLANIFLHIPALSLAVSGISVMIFSGYILYDVSRIVSGGETNYIMATLSLYLDIYNIFVNLLNILMVLMGNRD